MIDTRNPGWLHDLLPLVVDLVYQAGAAIMRLYDQCDSIAVTKLNGTLQTEADRLAHSILVNGLRKLSQEWPIVSEEGPEFPFAERERWHYFWLVDPLDGTKEFIRKTDEFTVNVALIESHVPVIGVVYAPARGTLYYAEKGEGAWKSNGDGRTQIRVRQSSNDPVRILVSRSHSGVEAAWIHEADRKNPCDVLAMGSSLKFCLVAEGTADLYPRTGRTMEWDTAAAQCILEEAGGSVIDAMTGLPVGYNKRLLVNNGFLAQGQRVASRDVSILST